jgi:PKD repeat protein
MAFYVNVKSDVIFKAHKLLPMKKIFTLLTFLLVFFAQNSNAAVTGADSVCAGEKVKYYVPYVAGASYSWSITGGTPLGILTTDSLTIQWGAAGVGTIIVTQFNPSAFHTLNVVINPKPNPLITHVPYPGCPSDTGSGNSSGQPDNRASCEKVCKLSTITYSTQLNVGSTYLWVVTGAQNVVGGNTNSATVTWDSSGAGSLIVYETNQWGCTDSSEVCIEKVNLPTAYFTHLSNACKFSSVLFNNLSMGATSFYWTFGDGGNSTQTNPSHSYANAGAYTITLIAFNNCHCSDTFQSVINIDSLPGPSVSCPSTLCAFDTATYSTPGGTGCIYNWFAIGGTIVGANNLPTVTVAWGAGQIGTLGLVVSGCVGVCSDTTLVYIPIVPATAVISGASKVCPGDCEYYTLPPFSGAGYTWSLNSGACGTLSDSVCCNQVRICWPNISYPCNDTLNVAYYDSFLRCGGTGQFIIRVRPRLEIIGNTTVCANSPATFNSSTGGNCFWAVAPVRPFTPAGPTPTITVNWLNTPGTYIIKAWPFNPTQSCNDTAYLTVKVIAVPAQPVITGNTIICPNSSANYCATGAGIINWVITGGTPVSSVGNCLTVLWGNSPPFIVRAYAQMPNSPFCNSDTAVQNVSPSSSIPPNIVAITPFCANSTNNFTAVGLYAPSATYTWSINLSNSGSILSPNTQSTQIQWGNNAPQTVTVSIVVNVCGLSLPKTTTVNLNPVPVPTVTQGGNLCAGGSATLLATGGGTYSWSGPSFSSVLNPVTISSAGLYQVTVTDANGCTALSQKNVQYVGGPTASISTLNNLGYCIGSSYAVTMCALGNAGYTYAWNVGGPTTQCRTFTTPGSYAVTVSDANSCTALSNFLVVHEDTCGGGSGGTCTPNGVIQFTHTSCNPISFTNTSINASPVCSWNFGDLTTSNIYSPTHTYTQAGFYLVTLTGYVYTTGTDSCLLQDTAQIEIPLAAKFDTLTGCSYDSVCFTDVSTYTAGNNITSWLWNFGDASTSTLQDPCHLYASPGVYTVTLTISNGTCTSVYSQTITVPNPPTASFTFGGPNCINQPVQFNDGSFTSINYWNWAFGDFGTSLNQNPFHSYTPAGVYPVTLIVHNNYGCYDTFVKNITISAPTLTGNITAFPDTIVCAGTNVLLVAPGCLTCNYLWSNGSTNDSITVTSTGIYSVTITDAGGCPYVTFIRIIVNNAPPVVIQNNGDADLCLGEFTSLFVTYNQNWTYSWLSNDPNANGTTGSGVFINSSLLGPGVFNYAVIVTDTTTGCGDTSLPYIITIHTPPVPPVITPLTVTTVCQGDTIILFASHPDPSVTLEWTTGEVTDTIYITENGCYGVQATDTFGCTSNSTLCVTVNPLPELCTFYEGCFDTCAPYTICAPGGSSWQWLNNGVPIPSATMQCYTTSASGLYSVIVTNSFGCVDTTGVLDLMLHPCDSLCADFWIDSVACDSTGNHVIYYHVSNQSIAPVTQVNLEILQPHLNVAFAPAVVFTNIPSGGTSPQLSTTIYNGTVGDTLCFRTHILAYDAMGMEIVCCYSDTDCIILPPCPKDTVPVDSTCCYFRFLGDSSWCDQATGANVYHFQLRVDGCGTLQIQTGPNTSISGSNPLVMTGSPVVINGTYTPSSPSDTIVCITFVMGNGVIYCADTTICINLHCAKPVPPYCNLHFEDSICVGQTTAYSYGGNPTGLSFVWQFPSGSPSTATGPGPHYVTYNTVGCFQVICIINNNIDCVDTICVLPPPVASVTQSGNTLLAYPSGYSYQWYTGMPGANPILGATNQFYNVTVTGFYCVVVSRNEYCSDTACIDHIPNSIDALNENSWSVYPNPNDGSFTLSISMQNGNAEMKVLNTIGEVVDERLFAVKNGKQDFFISNHKFAAGIYFIQLKTESGVGLKRMLVK